MDPEVVGAGRSTSSEGAGNLLTTAGLLNQIVPLLHANSPMAQQVSLIPLALKLEADRSTDAAKVEQAIGYRMLGGIGINSARAALRRDWNEAWSSAALRTEHLFAPGLNARFPGIQHLRLLFSTGERIESLCAQT